MRTVYDILAVLAAAGFLWLCVALAAFVLAY